MPVAAPLIRFDEIQPILARYLEEFEDLSARLANHTHIMVFLNQWKGQLQQLRDEPIYNILTVLTMALRHTEDTEVTREMAEQLVEIIRGLHVRMTREDGRRIGVALNRSCFALWPHGDR
jgi:hypothetical protein